MNAVAMAKSEGPGASEARGRETAEEAGIERVASAPEVAEKGFRWGAFCWLI